jgi:hypothetical protein
MRRLVPLLLLAPCLVSAGAARGDGCPPLTCGAVAVSAPLPDSPLLAFRPVGTGGPLTAYDVAARRLRFQLPAGVLSADGRSYFSTQLRRHTTVFARYDAHSGRRVARWSVAGRFSLAAASSTGRWLALLTLTGRAGPWRAAVIDTRARAVVKHAVLPQNDALEAISPTGRRLYLVHALNPNDPLDYRLELSDFATHELRANPPRDEQGSTEKMTGIARAAVGSTDGRWLLTVYVNQTKGYAFVHALDLGSGVAHCLDLAGALYDTAGEYALTLDRAQRTLYVAAPNQGALQAIDLRTLEVGHVVRFRGVADTMQAALPSAAVSRDGTLAFGSGVYVWRLHDRRMRRSRPLVAPVEGLAFAPRGTLVALTAQGLSTVR